MPDGGRRASQKWDCHGHQEAHLLTQAMKFSVPEPVRSAIEWPTPQTVAKSTSSTLSFARRASARLTSVVSEVSPCSMPVRILQYLAGVEVP